MEAQQVRDKLPTRRPCETVDLRYDNQTYAVSIGYYPEEVDGVLWHRGRIGEVFVNGPRIGSERHTDLMSVGVTASFALQHGAKPKRMARSHPRNEDGSYASVQGAIWGRLAAESKE